MMQPLLWNTSEVCIILMVCYNKNDRYIFNEVFESITTSLTDKYKFEHMLECTSAKQFIRELANISNRKPRRLPFLCLRITCHS